jgi:hypothetical protein
MQYSVFVKQFQAVRYLAQDGVKNLVFFIFAEFWELAEEFFERTMPNVLLNAVSALCRFVVTELVHAYKLVRMNCAQAKQKKRAGSTRPPYGP